MNSGRPAPYSRPRPRSGRDAEPRDGGIYVDATFGAGGYSRTILEPAGPASSASTATGRPSPAGSIWSTDRPAG